MKTSVTENDLLDAIRTALAKPTGDGKGKTVRQLAVESGYNEHRIRKSLQRIAAEGRLETGKTPEVSIDGRTFMIPCYRIKSP